MKKLFYILSFISITLFIYNAVNLSQRFEYSLLQHVSEIKGFEDTNSTNEYQRLIEKFRQKIRTYEDQAAKDQNIYFWLSFIVTALTAGSTLVSSIQAAKKNPNSDPKRMQQYSIIIALLAFVQRSQILQAAIIMTLKPRIRRTQ